MKSDYIPKSEGFESAKTSPMVKKTGFCYSGSMTKIFFAAFMLFFSIFTPARAVPDSAQPKRYMFCLGQEEQNIHKNNIGGPVYKLNQNIIGALVQLRDSIFMKSRRVQQVCEASFPSIKLLELLMTEEDLFFSRFTRERSPKLLAIDEGLLRELKRSSAGLFTGFIADIQATLDKPGCLLRHIPELREFLEKMQYAQENLGLEKMIERLGDPREVFRKLQSLDYKNIQC